MKEKGPGGFKPLRAFDIAWQSPRAYPLDYLDKLWFLSFDKDMFAYKSTMKVKLKILKFNEQILVSMLYLLVFGLCP